MKKVGYYIEKEEYVNNIINYKYVGDDRSITVKYILSPLCNFLVNNIIPPYIAPNLITVSGWFLNLFYFTVTTVVVGWKGATDIPKWVQLLVGHFYLTYIILDYCDGKQARKLKASSALGLLVDHGTDACTTFFVTCGLGTVNYFTSLNQYLCFHLGISAAFFFNTWEEFYLGVLNLPMIHGVAEGAFGIYIVCIFVAYMGYEGIVIRKLVGFAYLLTFSQFIRILMVTAGIFFALISVFNVIRKLDKKIKPDALKTALMYPLWFGTLFFTGFAHKDSIIVREYPKFLIITFGFEFAKLMSVMQLSHVKKSPYPCYRPVFLAPILICLIHSLFYYFTKKNLIVSINIIIPIIFVFNLLSWAHFVIFASEEICEILNINRFVLGKRHPKISDKEDNKKSS